MKQFFRRLWYVLTATKELDALVEAERKRIEEKEREENRHRLDLCFKHRQEANHSVYSEKNCHYCQLQNHADYQHAMLLDERKACDEVIKEKNELRDRYKEVSELLADATRGKPRKGNRT